MPQKKPSPAQTEKKATPKPKGKAVPKKAVKPASPAKKAPAKKIPAQTQPPTNWRVASPQPKATEEPQPAPCRALMVIPQPEPWVPWEQFKHDLPESFDGFLTEITGGSHMAAFCKELGINTTMLKFVAVDPSRSEMHAREGGPVVLGLSTAHQSSAVLRWRNTTPSASARSGSSVFGAVGPFKTVKLVYARGLARLYVGPTQQRGRFQKRLNAVPVDA